MYPFFLLTVFIFLFFIAINQPEESLESNMAIEESTSSEIFSEIDEKFFQKKNLPVESTALKSVIKKIYLRKGWNFPPYLKIKKLRDLADRQL